MTALALALLLAAGSGRPLAAAGPALQELEAASDVSRKAAAAGSERSASLARAPFSGLMKAPSVRAPGVPRRASQEFGTRRSGPHSFKPGEVPAIYAAETGAVPAAKAAKKKPAPNNWDFWGTLKSVPFALAGATIGFLLGGPIGAAAGFLIGLLIGACLWKGGLLGKDPGDETPKKPAS